MSLSAFPGGCVNTCGCLSRKIATRLFSFILWPNKPALLRPRNKTICSEHTCTQKKGYVVEVVLERLLICHAPWHGRCELEELVCVTDILYMYNYVSQFVAVADMILLFDNTQNMAIRTTIDSRRNYFNFGHPVMWLSGVTILHIFNEIWNIYYYYYYY